MSAHLHSFGNVRYGEMSFYTGDTNNFVASLLTGLPGLTNDIHL